MNSYSDPNCPDPNCPSIGLEWALLTQPKVYPVGNGIEDVLGLVRALTPDPQAMKAMDRTVLDMFSGTAAMSEAVAATSLPDKLPLIVKTNIKGANIRVMNIGPLYFDGMLLPSNKAYDVEVSADGYVTQRKWVMLNKVNEVVRFELARDD